MNWLTDLENSKCVLIIYNDIRTINFGKIAAICYIHYTTIEMFRLSLKRDSNVHDLLNMICNAYEFKDLPLRHGEGIVLTRIRQWLQLPVPEKNIWIDPRAKVYILLQAHLSKIPITHAALKEDLNQILMKSVRLIQAFVELSSCNRWLGPALSAMKLAQWHTDSVLKQIPHFDDLNILERCEEANIKTVFDFKKLFDAME